MYTLQELDGPPKRRIMYHLPECVRAPFYVFHATPSFHGATARPDLMTGYVPSLESQIIVLEALCNAWPVILVTSIRSSSQKRQYTQRHLSRFLGRTRDRSIRVAFHITPAIKSVCSVAKWPILFLWIVLLNLEKEWEAPPRIASTCTSGTSISESLHAQKISATPTHQTVSSTSLVGLLSRTSIIKNLPFTAAVCYRPFSRFAGLFLEQNRLTLIWVGFVL